MDKDTIKNLADLVSFNTLVAGTLILIIAWGLVHFLESISNNLSTRFPRYRLQINRLFPLARLIIWSIALYIAIVDVINPPENTALAILASAGLAVGLAAQDTVRNIMSGILILFDQPFRVGDMIKIGDYYGEVVRIDSRSTRLRTFDDNIVSFPNAFVWTQTIANSNSGNLDEMVVTTLMLPAYVDIQTIKDIAWEAAAASPYAYLKKPINVLIEDQFNRSFLTKFIIKTYVIDVRYERLLNSDITENIKAELIKRKLMDKDTVSLVAQDDTKPASASPKKESTFTLEYK